MRKLKKRSLNLLNLKDLKIKIEVIVQLKFKSAQTGYAKYA